MRIVFTKTVLLVLVVLATNAIAQETKRKTIEQAYFKILQMPDRFTRGTIEVYPPDRLTNGSCNNCGQRYRFDNSVQIRVAGETSSIGLNLVAQLPQQLAYLVVEGNQVRTIGFQELVRPERLGNDL